MICRSLVAGHEPVLVEHGSLADGRCGTLADRPFISLVPTQLHRLLDDPASVAALRWFHTVLLGGGPIDPALRARAAEEGLRVVATYGSAETAGGCVYDGYPLDGVGLEVDDDGRIRICGPTLFDGYDGDPELTAGSSWTAGSSPPTPDVSTTTAGCRSWAGSTTWWSAGE